MKSILATTVVSGVIALLSISQIDCEHACNKGVDKRCDGRNTLVCGGTAEGDGWSSIEGCAEPGWPDSACIDPGNNAPFCVLVKAPIAECGA